jgi:3-hydroxybutyryl-CoA dehydrogenase
VLSPGEMPSHGEAARTGGHGFRVVGVVGAGLMGRRIAAVLAAGGLAVRLTDVRADVLGEASAEAVELAHALAAAAGGTAGTVTAAGDLETALADADLVVEAIVEDLALKQELFGLMAGLCPAAVLATNTSVLPVTAVAARVRDGSRVLGTHFWNPPDLVPLVEVVLGARTDPEVADRVTALLRALGRLPVLVRRDVPGFIGNRLQHALWREAFAIVAEGVADAETVDLVARNTIGLRLGQMGPIENADYVGLDLTLAIHRTVLAGLDRSTAPNPLLRAHVAAGRLGARAGQGFLPWPDGRREAAAAGLAAHVAAQLALRSNSTHGSPTGKDLG